MAGFLNKNTSKGNNATKREAYNSANASNGKGAQDRTFGPSKDQADLRLSGSAGSNVVSVKEIRVDNDTRHPLEGKWVKRARNPVDYNHSN